MTLKKFVINSVKNFNSATDGSIAPLFAITVPVILGISGLAIEYSKISNEKTKLESALDATVLNIGSQIFKKSNTDVDYREQFEDMFRENVVGRGMAYKYTLENFGADDATGELSAKVSANMNTSFLGVLGIKTVKVEAESAATFKQPKTEITMMLDTTGSMSGDKIEALQNAANNAIGIFLSDSDDDVRIGLVPYSATINIGSSWADLVTQNNTDAESISGFTSPEKNVDPGNCVSERDGLNRATDASYEDAPIGSNEIAVNYAQCPNAAIMPLTSNRTALTERINSMTTDGGTAGHLGIAWSYYMLSEKWKGLWGTANVASSYGDAKKVAIIMTDGEFNTVYEELGGGTSSEASERLALELCNDMKAPKDGNSGIIIYSIAFEAGDDAEELLKACANEDTNSTTYYYSADGEEELTAAFEAIADSVTELRLSR